MSGTSSNANQSDGGKQKRGSVRNKDRLEAFARPSVTGGADWGGVHPDKVHAVVHLLTALGGAVTFGMSRDNGAYSVTLMLDEKRKTLWFNGDVDLDESLQEVIDTLTQIT